MKKQTDQQQKTQGKTTKDSHNQEQIQTQDKELLNLKVDKGEKEKMNNKTMEKHNTRQLLRLETGILVQTRRRPHTDGRRPIFLL